MQDPYHDPPIIRQEDPAQPAPGDVAPQVTDPGPAATTAQGSAETDPAAGPGPSPTPEDAEAEAEAEAEGLPYRMGNWCGYPMMVCTWVRPNGVVCEAGFLKEEEFWSHHHDHVIREMTPEERASLVEAMQQAQQPSAVAALVRPDGSPLGR